MPLRPGLPELTHVIGVAGAREAGMLEWDQLLAAANAAVIGVPDRELGEVIRACILLTAGTAASEALEEQIQEHVRVRLASYQRPREIEFLDALPMTTTGKVQRRVLRERSLRPA